MRHRIPFVERDVTEDPAALADLRGLGFASTPVLVIDGVAEAGFRTDRVSERLGLPRAGDGEK